MPGTQSTSQGGKGHTTRPGGSPAAPAARYREQRNCWKSRACRRCGTHGRCTAQQETVASPVTHVVQSTQIGGGCCQAVDRVHAIQAAAQQETWGPAPAACLPVGEARVDEAEEQRRVALALAVQDAGHRDAPAQRGHLDGPASEQLGCHSAQPLPAAEVRDAPLLLLCGGQGPPGQRHRDLHTAWRALKGCLNVPLEAVTAGVKGRGQLLGTRVLGSWAGARLPDCVATPQACQTNGPPAALKMLHMQVRQHG